MLNAVVKVNQIDYEANLKRVFPRVNANIKAITSDSAFVQKFQKLGDEAESVAFGILANIASDERGQIVADGVNANTDWMVWKFNGKAAKYTGGEIIKIGNVGMSAEGDALVARCENISVIYKDLVGIESVKVRVERLLGGVAGSIATMGVKAVTTIAPDKFEKTVIDLLGKPDNKKKLVAYANQLLKKYGFFANVVDIDLVQIPHVDVATKTVEDKLTVPADIETKLEAAWK